MEKYIFIAIIILQFLSRYKLKKEYDTLRVDNDKLKRELDDFVKRCNNLECDKKNLHNKANKLLKQVSYSDENLAKLSNNISKHLEYSEHLNDTINEQNCQIMKLTAEINKRQNSLQYFLDNKVKSMPWLAGMIADYITYDIEILAKSLDWGSNVERKKKVASIRDIRKDASSRIAEAKVAVYQLDYLKQLFPDVELILNSDYEDLDFSPHLEDYNNPLLSYISTDEYQALSSSERNQLALDRYIASHKKSKWQIGRDYESYVGYRYLMSGYKVDFYGTFMGKDDLGRDLIAIKNGIHYIVQCKYWSQKKVIHEKHICQLYGTLIEYSIDKDVAQDKVVGVLVTNTYLSGRAKLFANRLHIKYLEDYSMGEFPRIKCNIGKDQYGEQTKIYHLPMDQQYDSTKIDKPGECYAFTVKEAEEKGFRHASNFFG